MNTGERFLRPNVIVEPLVDGFYAWFHTVAPVQAAMNLAFLQAPLLESYLEDPSVHTAASRNPALRGGYFVDIAEDRAEEVKALLAAVHRERAPMLRFAQAIAEAEDLLRRSATGFDLTSLYAELPAELAGLVELAYDTNNQAQLRVLEPLVYRSEAFMQDRQSVQLSFEPTTERPFILSTPRLPADGVLDLPIPFRHPGLEALFRARVHPTTLSELSEALELDDVSRL